LIVAEPRRARTPETADEELVFPAESVCFGCSPRNAAGLHLRFFRDGDGVRCDTTMDAAYQGAPGVVHGGMQAVLLDETCCAAAFFTIDAHVVTGKLDLRYRRPCPIGTPLRVRAAIVRDEGRYLVIRAAICAADGGPALTEAEGRFYRDRSRAEPAP
jgi:acyl-coenzyme A thioesterase PaaI-like protein